MTAAPTAVFGCFFIAHVLAEPDVLLSLHLTKAGAWRAMHSAQWNAWIELQRADREPRYVTGRPRLRGEKLPPYSTWFIRRMEVRP